MLPWSANPGEPHGLATRSSKLLSYTMREDIFDGFGLQTGQRKNSRGCWASISSPASRLSEDHRNWLADTQNGSQGPLFSLISSQKFESRDLGV